MNFEELYRQLTTNLSNCVLYIGLVKYLDKRIIDHIHEPQRAIDEMFIRAKESDNPYYYHFFREFSIDHFLNLMLLKRDAFEHEHEIRLFIVPNSQESVEKRKFVELNWVDLIEQVRIDCHCSDKEKEKLQKALNQLYTQKKKAISSNNNDNEELNDDFTTSYERINPISFDIYSSDLTHNSILTINIDK